MGPQPDRIRLIVYFTREARFARCTPLLSRDGEIGRRAGLKIQYWRQCASSSLAPGTRLRIDTHPGSPQGPEDAAYPTTEKLLSLLISRIREQNRMSSVKSMFGSRYCSGFASWSLPLST